ncbi:U3 snoRNA binding protein [Aureococcus anophagefferens]|nr:U3 snoRNA binding protein [Aureococcus anophagefferens]
MSLCDDDGDGGAGDDAAGDGDDDDGRTRSSPAAPRSRSCRAAGVQHDAARLGLEGLSSGQYVRVRLERVPCEFVDHLSPRRPVILGGLLPHEAAGVARHGRRAAPLSAPLYSLEDERQTRSRYLKYTPEHMHCGATFWAPGIAPNSPLVGFHSLSSSSTTFRVSCVGVVLKQEATSKVSKKLKLCGAPYKVERNTAFVDGMFTSALEAAKFEGATLKTVSGVRGAIKKAVREGVSRRQARVALRELRGQGARRAARWRTVASSARHADGHPVDKDSLYRPVDRAPRAFHKQAKAKAEYKRQGRTPAKQRAKFGDWRVAGRRF